MAIKNGKIIDVDIQNLDSKYTSTKIIDLNGETIIQELLTHTVIFIILVLISKLLTLEILSLLMRLFKD